MPKELLTIIKHGVAHHVRITPILEIEGLIQGLDMENLRDETDRIC